MSSMLNDYLEKKKQVFDPLEALDHSSDDEPDLGRKASEDALKQAVSRQQQKQQAIPDGELAQKLARSVSDDIHRSRVDLNPPPHSTNPTKGKERAYLPPSSTDPKNIKGMPKPPPSSLTKTVSDNTTTGPSGNLKPAKVIGKRKREHATRLMPEALRVFRDLHFYFFPNNDSAPARKMRIVKACEYGATWHKQWDTQVTHVIVDKSMSFEQLMKWLKLDKLPDHIVVVNGSYPAECITYGVLLDPSIPKFAVKGLALSRADSTESNPSLQLKATRKTAQSLQTPPKEDAVEILVSAHVTNKDAAD